MPCILSKPSSLTTATSVVIGRSSSPSFNTICRAICNSTLVSDLSALGDCGYSSGPVPRTACPRRRLGPVSRTARLVSGSVPRTAQPRRRLGLVSRTARLVSGSVSHTVQPCRLQLGVTPYSLAALARCHTPYSLADQPRSHSRFSRDGPVSSFSLHVHAAPRSALWVVGSGSVVTLGAPTRACSSALCVMDSLASWGWKLNDELTARMFYTIIK